MKIIYADVALMDLEEILRWNTKHYDLEHAENYIQFLRQSIRELAETQNAANRSIFAQS